MGANNFVALPVIPRGASTGPRAAVDLWAVIPDTGLNPGFTAICAGDFQGTIVLEGSLTGTSFSPIGVAVPDGTANSGVAAAVGVGGFTLGERTGVAIFELTPLLVPDVVRYVRARVAPGTTIFGPVQITLGGGQNCLCADVGPLDSVQETYVNDQGVTLTEGQIVGVDDGSNFAIRLAQAGANPNNIIGPVAAPILAGAEGPVTVSGRGVVLMEVGLTLSPGQKIFASTTVAGRGTNVAPSTNAVPIGVIASTATYGVDRKVEATITGIDVRSAGGAFAQGANVPAAATLTLPSTADTFVIMPVGLTTITNIPLNGRVAGAELTLILPEGGTTQIQSGVVGGNIRLTNDTFGPALLLDNLWFGDPLATMFHFKYVLGFSNGVPGPFTNRWLMTQPRVQLTSP